MSDASQVTIQDWIFRIRPPESPVVKAVLLAIHGRTGNEGSMEVFIQKLKMNFWILLPRAPFQDDDGGYTWRSKVPADRQDFDAYTKRARELNERIAQICREFQIDDLPLYLLGFSQGSALSLAYSLSFPVAGQRAGLLAGFLPSGAKPQPGILAESRYFVAHGRQDQTLPVEQGRNTVRFLEECGARVDYCESDAGHKLSMACFKQMESFFLEGS